MATVADAPITEPVPLADVTSGEAVSETPGSRDLTRPAVDTPAGEALDPEIPETAQLEVTPAIPAAPAQVTPTPAVAPPPMSEPTSPPLYQTPPSYAVTQAPVAESSSRAIGAEDLVYTPYALSIGDGFKFGCGILLASMVGLLFLVLVITVAVLIASLAGVSLPFGMSGI
jgi:hypothetical protein